MSELESFYVRRSSSLSGQEESPEQSEVHSFDLVSAPVGQHFIISRLGRGPLHGIVEDPEWPVVSFRDDAFGTPLSRWLQVPFGADVRRLTREEQEHMPPLEKVADYYARFSQGIVETEVISVPDLHILERASFLRIDENGKPVTSKQEVGGGLKDVVSISTVAVKGLQLPSLTSADGEHLATTASA